MATTATLARTTFRTSRLMDFCSEKELVAQTGHQTDDWALVVLKELMDNGLDACEDAGIAPKISVTADASGIAVTDNGPGIPADTVEGVLDFAVRVSNREAYVAPDRGRQGNALKTIVAMPFVLDGGEGRIEVHARGINHQVGLRVDRIRQQPIIDHAKAKSKVKTGTTVRILWPDSASSKLTDARKRFLQIAADYSIVNPHLGLNVDWFGEKFKIAATAPGWEKWKPSDPTSPHWYEAEQLERLIAAYVSHDADSNGNGDRPARTVRELVSEFRGLSGTAKQKSITTKAGLRWANLADLADNGAIATKAVSMLLAAMKESSKPVKPTMLGVIGKDHLHRRLKDMGCAMQTFDYKRTVGTDAGLPWVIETAFAAFSEALGQGDSASTKPNGGDSRFLQIRSGARRLVTGVNWSPGIINPFRELGRVGESLDSLLADQEACAGEPVALVLHLACPRVQYMDRGKSSVVIERGNGE